jgi:Fe2+ or Zn2+ uptake regulation protein
VTRLGTRGADMDQPAIKTYRNTTQRAEILAEVRSAERHLTAGEIFERVRRRNARIAYGTVYRSLHVLAEQGLILELTFADEASRFDARVDRHDHVQCQSCGMIDDVDVPVALLAGHIAGEQTGFQVTGHHTVFTGLCPQCRATSGASEVGIPARRRPIPGSKPKGTAESAILLKAAHLRT